MNDKVGIMRTESYLRGPTVRGSFISMCLTLVLLSGCSPQQVNQSDKATTDETVVSTQQWAELIADVRSGKSDEIRFTNSPVTIDQANELKIACQKLRVLNIDHSNLNNDLFAEVLALLPLLEQLQLVGPVENDQLASIAKYAPQLQVLNIPAGNFDDEGLFALKEMPQLSLLRFHSPHVTDRGMKTIAELPELRFLHLINVPITDAGLQVLPGMNNLESFYLDGSQCTEEGLSELVKARPDLHFHWNQLHLKHDPQAHQH